MLDILLFRSCSKISTSFSPLRKVGAGARSLQIRQVVPVSINPGGVSYVKVTYQGEVSGLRSALAARGWSVEQNGYVLRMSSSGNAPPPVAPPPQPQTQQPAPAPQPPPSQPPGGDE